MKDVYDPNNIIESAQVLGAYAHRNQVRNGSGKNYFYDHCVPVAEMVKQRGGSAEMIAAALLHDSLEDTDVDPKVINLMCGPVVLQYVRTLTDTPKSVGNRAMRKALDRHRLASATEEEQRIKLCDIDHNLDSALTVFAQTKFIDLYLKEMGVLLPVLDKPVRSIRDEVTKKYEGIVVEWRELKQ